MENLKKTWVVDGYTWLHCPVCGEEVMDYDICDNCGWQNTGIINHDGGPNPMTLEEVKISIKVKAEKQRPNHSYAWLSRYYYMWK